MRGRFDEGIQFEVTSLPPRRWRLEKPLRFRSPWLHAWVCVPNGFVSDAASVPASLAWLFPREGRGFRAAVIHDWLYRSGSILTGYGPEQISRDDADEVYLEALEACGVRWLQRHGAWLAVRLFGGRAWDKHRNADDERTAAPPAHDPCCSCRDFGRDCPLEPDGKGRNPARVCVAWKPRDG